MSLFDSDDTSSPSAPERAGGKVVWLVVIGLALLVAGGYAAAALTAGEKVPRGTTVAGVDIGGRESDDAVTALEEALAGRLDDPIQVEVDDRTAAERAGSARDRRLTVDPQAAGLAVDYEASVAAAGGSRSWSPGRLWDYYTGGDDLDAVLTVDDAKMADALDELEGKAGTPARNGRWRFKGGSPKEIDPVVGHGLEPEVAEDELTEAYLDGLAGEDAAAELELVEVQPDIDADDMREARESFVNPAMSEPITLTFGTTDVQLRPRDYVRALRLNPVGGELEPGVNAKGLQRFIDDVTAERGEPVDATVKLVNGKPKVVRGKPGVTYDPEEAKAAFLTVVTKDGDERRAQITAKADKPDFTTGEARALKIKEKVSEFTTYFPHADYRNINLGRASELINGTLLKPGDVFSLNEIVGERTEENGFTTGYIIDNGILVQDLGGGVSQMATTTFNAMFFAGLKDIEHKPHSFFIDRYPEGREATVAWPSLDLKFQNDTPYGVLIEAFVEPSSPASQGAVTVRMYSTKYWDIETRKSERYDHTAPTTRTLTSDDCEPFTGWSGFKVDVWRNFRKPGSDEVVKSEKFHTEYTPADSVVCREPRRARPAGAGTD